VTPDRIPPSPDPVESWRRLIAVVVLTSVSGCSFALTGPDPQRPPSTAPECDTGKGLVGLDGLLGGTFAIGALAALGAEEDGVAALTGLISVAFIASAVRGNTAVNECRVAMADYSGRPSLDEQPQVATKRPPPKRPAQPPTVMQRPPEDPYTDEPPYQAPYQPPVVAPPVKTVPAKPAPPPAKPKPEPEPVTEDWKDFWTEVP
jgi:hypothetical protein